MAVLLSAACLLPACLDAQEVDESEGALRDTRSEVRYLDYNPDTTLFADDTRIPVASFIGFGEGVTVMFGHDGRSGRLQFAYFAAADRFDLMLAHAQSESASVFLAPGSDEGLPWNKKPPSPPPIGEDLVPYDMVNATSALSIGIVRAENAFAGSFEGGTTRDKF